MKELFRKVIQINQMENDQDKEDRARDFFCELNTAKIPEYFNWVEEIFEGLHLKENPDKKALIWTDIDTLEIREYSYKDLYIKANKLINLLLKEGIEKGDNMYMMNSVLPETWFAGIACVKKGLVSVPTATTMTQRELEFRFETYPPHIIMADRDSADLIDTAIEKTGKEPKVKLFLGQKNGWIPFDSIEGESSEAEAEKTRADDIIFCFFTSGTTGFPKRVGHTAVSYPVGHLSTAIMTGIGPDDTHNNLSAPGWAKWAWSSFFVPFNVGATASGFKFSVFNGKQYLDAVSRHKVTTMCGPPAAWRMFASMNLGSLNLSTLRHSLSAGEPINPGIIDRWKKHTGNEIRDFYGQTESTAMIGNPPWLEGKIRSGSFGYPSFMYDVALADNEGEEIMEPGNVGHVVVKLDKWRAIGLFSEYIGMPDKMSSVFVGNYYYTGDRAYFDSEGFWWFVGRADDVIKSSDYRIGPFEVESALVEHSAVAEAAVVGTPDRDRYQLVKAYVVLSPNYEKTKELALELFKHTMNILAEFKIPRIIEFVSEIPKTISGKIRRIELRQIEIAKKSDEANKDVQEYFYWDFPELSSKKRLSGSTHKRDASNFIGF